MTASIPVQADGEVISELITRSVDATSSTIQVDGQSYQWGQESNLELDGFSFENKNYVKNLKASSVSVRRRAIPNPDIPDKEPAELCGVFAERHGSNGNEVKPDFTALTNQAGICDMSAMLMSSIINRGTLDTFTNTGANPNNIERIDFLFNGGIVAPSDPLKLASAGHAIGEKKGNNSVQVAAIKKMESGRPTAYWRPLVSVRGRISVSGRISVGERMCPDGSICYDESSIVHDYAFFKSHSLEPLRDLQALEETTERVTFAFLSMKTLGVPAGGTYYGISVFPHDVIEGVHVLTDINTFPDDTQESEVRPDDTADIYGGAASLYIIPSGITGRVFCQADDNETAPKANVPISLFRDTVADGGVLDDTEDELIQKLPGTSMLGRYSFLGLDNGSYFVVAEDRPDDDAATLAIVINSSHVEDADIFLNESCLPDDDPGLVVETEVEGIGVGRIPPLACFLLLTFVVIRRYTLLAKGKGELS